MTPWTVAYQAPPSIGFSKQEYWNGLLFPPPGDLLDPGIKPASPVSPALQADSLPIEPPGQPWWTWVWANSGRWWRTGKPGVLQFTGSERVGYDWATEQQLVLLCQGDTHMFAFEKKTKFSQTLIVHELWKLRVFILAVTFSLPSATNTWKYAEIPMHKLRRMKFPIHYATCYSYKNLMGKK